MTNMGRTGRARQYVNLAEAKARLSELVDRAAVGDEVVIAKDHRPVAKLVPLGPLRARRTPGSAKGQVWMAADFEATPDDFAPYLK